MAEEIEDEAFFISTKDFRKRVKVNEMINERKKALTKKKSGENEHGDLYKTEYSAEYMKPVNVEKIMRIT